MKLYAAPIKNDTLTDALRGKHVMSSYKTLRGGESLLVKHAFLKRWSHKLL